MMSLGSDLLSARASVVWIAALCAVLVFHCSHLIHMRGERCWYHSAHIAMLIGMLYMYAAVAFGFDWLPAQVWMILYAATSAAIIGWMLLQYIERRAFGPLWILALVQQGAMIYMWMPMTVWVPRVSYALAVYFGLETMAWLTRAFKPWSGNAVTGASGPVVIPLAHRSAFGNICMTIMAASMGYMFAGMQLMMMSVPQHPKPMLTQQQQPAPSQSESRPGHSEPGVPVQAQAPKVAGNEPARPAPDTLPPSAAERYTIGSGDTLRRIAARHYGNPRLWRSIMQANPGLDPRRLHIGQVISLPLALSP